MNKMIMENAKQANTDNEESYEVWDLGLRTVYIRDEIDDSLKDLLGLLHLWAKEDRYKTKEECQPIYIFIDSCGGSAYVSIQLYDALMRMKAPIITVNIGECSSAGNVIYAAGDERYAFPYSFFLWHDGVTMNSNSFLKAKSMAKHQEHTLDIAHQITRSRSNVSKEEFEAKMGDDWFFYAEEALHRGVCTKIVESFQEVIPEPLMQNQLVTEVVVND